MFRIKSQRWTLGSTHRKRRLIQFPLFLKAEGDRDLDVNLLVFDLERISPFFPRPLWILEKEVAEGGIAAAEGADPEISRSIDKASWIFYIFNKEGRLQIRLDKASFCFLRKRTYALLVYSQNDVLSFQGKEVSNRGE